MKHLLIPILLLTCFSAAEARSKMSHLVVLDSRALGELDRSHTVDVALDLLARHGGELDHVYSTVFHGFSARLTEAQVASLWDDWRIAWIEIDRTVTLSEGSFTLPSRAEHVYVVGTGVRHGVTPRRLGSGYDVTLDTLGTFDCHGHGSQVAARVAREHATVHPIRVLDCQGRGRVADVVAGLDWLAARDRRPAALALTVQHAVSETLDFALEGVMAAGIEVIEP